MPLICTVIVSLGMPTVCYENYLHGMCEHTSKSERNLLGELLAMHGDFKAVTEIDVNNFAGRALQ